LHRGYVQCYMHRGTGDGSYEQVDRGDKEGEKMRRTREELERIGTWWDNEYPPEEKEVEEEVVDCPW